MLAFSLFRFVRPGAFMLGQDATDQDRARVTQARGLSDREVRFGHALKNTLVPVITITVFQWPGIDPRLRVHPI